MEKDPLRAFVAVPQHRTQSAVSKQRTALEEEHGDPGFERSAPGRLPSAVDMRLQPLAQRIRNSGGAAQQMHGPVSGTLRLGAIIDSCVGPNDVLRRASAFKV